jgi:hypothetical protein
VWLKRIEMGLDGSPPLEPVADGASWAATVEVQMRVWKRLA